VVPTLYEQHKGEFILNSWSSGDPGALTGDESSSVDAAIETYGPKSGQWLTALVHMERPWIDARRNLDPEERGHSEISPEAMAEYYGSLT
jgi:uncharacterized phage-associated protein